MTTTTQQERMASALPPPLVKPTKHPMKWLWQTGVRLVDAGVFAHLGMLFVVGLYYAAFELSPTANSWWHHAVSNSDLRHSIRDVGEGVIGGFLALAITWNHFKRSHKRVGRWSRSLKARAHIPVAVTSLVGAAILGSLGFFIAYKGMHLFHYATSAPHPSGSVLDRTATIWNSDWDKKVMGYIAAFAARRPMRPLFDQAQAYFVDRRIDMRLPLRWYHPPTFKARYNYLLDHPDAMDRSDSTWVRYAAPLAVLVLLAGAAGGWYILTYIA